MGGMLNFPRKRILVFLLLMVIGTHSSAVSLQKSNIIDPIINIHKGMLFRSEILDANVLHTLNGTVLEDNNGIVENTRALSFVKITDISPTNETDFLENPITNITSEYSENDPSLSDPGETYSRNSTLDGWLAEYVGLLFIIALISIFFDPSIDDLSEPRWSSDDSVQSDPFESPMFTNSNASYYAELYDTYVNASMDVDPTETMSGSIEDGISLTNITKITDLNQESEIIRKTYLYTEFDRSTSQFTMNVSVNITQSGYLFNKSVDFRREIYANYKTQIDYEVGFNKNIIFELIYSYDLGVGREYLRLFVSMENQYLGKFVEEGGETTFSSIIDPSSETTTDSEPNTSTSLSQTSSSSVDESSSAGSLPSIAPSVLLFSLVIIPVVRRKLASQSISCYLDL